MNGQDSDRRPHTEDQTQHSNMAVQAEVFDRYEVTLMNKNSSPSARSPLPKLLTETQVSMIFNVSINTLRYWRHCGDGPNYIKLGKLVRYHEAELESYLQRKTCVSKARATAEENRVAH
jgi:predicted DNA-binding transcriptional regulator AlpA